MANDKNNINELVTADDDPTAELETLVLDASEPDMELESDAHTAGIDGRQATFVGTTSNAAQLQFDLAQLQAKYLGLEAEIESRMAMQNELLAELAAAKTSLNRKRGLLRKRDQQIKSLRQEIRQRNASFEQLQQELQDLARQDGGRTDDSARSEPVESAAAPVRAASADLSLTEVLQRHARMEEYADQLRRQLQDSRAAAGDDRNAREFLETSLQQAQERIRTLEAAAHAAAAQNAQLAEEFAALQATHAEEIRTLRFELGAAQETVTQQEMLTEQLASDLVETRTYRVELENMLSATAESTRSRIDELEDANRGLRRQLADSQQKLETKNEAINCLIAELARKSQQMETMAGLEGVMHDIDDRVADRIDGPGPVERDRVTRVLIGSIDDQELRFPLFKDRLTIGRTAQNDIQLKASHISRRHAVIVTEGSATRVIDWGSKNGVFVNSSRITEHFLKHGDVVSVGTAKFRYEERPKRDA